MKKIYLLFCFDLLSKVMLAQPGTLDTHFGEEGKLLNNFPSNCNALAVGTDGKIISGGSGSVVSSDQGYFLVQKYNMDGSPDVEFGDSGKVFTGSEIGATFGYVNSLAVQPDNKIIAGGSLFGRYYTDIALTKYNSDGSLDESFGNKGIVLTDLGDNYDYAYDIALQPDGKIVLVGSSNNPLANIRSSVVIRYLSNGSLDESFGNKGVIRISPASNNLYFMNSIALQKNGRIVVGGSGSEFSSNSYNYYLLIRYLPDGTIDPTFGKEGIAQLTFPGKQGYYADLIEIAVQTDDKILAAGRSGNDSTALTVARFNSNGIVDSGFGENGYTAIRRSGTTSESRNVLIQQDNKIVVVGPEYLGRNSFIAARFTTNGTVDSSFGEYGIAATQFPNKSYCNAGALQQDGKVLAGGYAETDDFDNVPSVSAITRFESDRKELSPITRIRRWIKKYVLNFEDVQPNNTTAYYTVEQSSNGVRGFRQVARISANSQQSAVSGKLPVGSHQTSNIYSYNLQPATNSQQQTANFYRIGATDRNGNVVYSDVIADNESTNQSTVQLFPNPVKDVLHINGLSSTMNYELITMNSSGDILNRVNASNASVSDINVSGLKQGNYYLLINTNNTKQTLQFVKE